MKQLRLQRRKCLAILSVLTLVLSVMFTMGAPIVSAESTNLLTKKAFASGDQALSAFTLDIGFDATTGPAGIWAQTYAADTFANAKVRDISTHVYKSGTSIDSATAGEMLTDGVTDSAASASVGLEFVRDAGANASYRRKALLIKLGGSKMLDSIVISLSSGYYLYDCSIYAGNTSEVSALITADNFVKNQTWTDRNSTREVALTNARDVQYVLITFNKHSNDHGTAPDGLTMQASPDAKVYLAELAITGTEYVAPTNVLTYSGLTGATQSVTGYQFATTPTATSSTNTPLWDLTYPYTYGTSKALNTTYSPCNGLSYTMLADGIYDHNEYNGDTNDAVQIDWGANPDNNAYATKAARRLALLFDLGASYDLDHVTMRADYTWRTYGIYDYTVYAGNTDDVDELVNNCVGHFYTETNGAEATVSLNGASNMRYVLVVFNKLSTDPGASGGTYEGQYGANSLPATSSGYGGCGTVRLAEAEIYGWAAAAVEPEEPVEPAAPVANGSTINVNTSNAIAFFSKLPADAVPTGYTVSEYGILVIPNQFLPGESNAKEGAALEYGNDYVLAATYEVAEGDTITPDEEFSAELIGSDQGIYPGVKFAARSYIIYQKDGSEESEIVYGETEVRSVWAVARSMVTAIFEAKEAGSEKLDGIELTFDNTGVPEDYTAALAAAATSKTDVNLDALYQFVCANAAAVAAVA